VQNWNQFAGYPDDSGDTATITTQGNGWPVLDDDYCIGSPLSMDNDAELDMNDYTLKVDGKGVRNLIERNLIDTRPTR